MSQSSSDNQNNSENAVFNSTGMGGSRQHKNIQEFVASVGFVLLTSQADLAESYRTGRSNNRGHLEIKCEKEHTSGYSCASFANKKSEINKARKAHPSTTDNNTIRRILCKNPSCKNEFQIEPISANLLDTSSANDVLESTEDHGDPGPFSRARSSETTAPSNTNQLVTQVVTTCQQRGHEAILDPLPTGSAVSFK